MSNDFNMCEIGRIIARHRKAHNMTQMELADRMNVSFQAVSNWERGQSMPDISKLPELAECFGVSIDELLGRSVPLITRAAEGTLDGYLAAHDVSLREIAEAAPGQVHQCPAALSRWRRSIRTGRAGPESKVTSLFSGRCAVRRNFSVR